MARRTFMMSSKKRASLKKQEELQKQQQEKQRLQLLQPLFSKVAPGKSKVPKIADYRAEDTKHIKSHNSESVSPAATARKEPDRYTGTNLLGIGVMHKSNLVPIFNTQDAEHIAKMRRN